MAEPQIPEPETVELSPEALKARNRRNIWLGLALAAFVVMVAVITMIRLSENDLSQGGFYYDPQDRPSDAQALPPGMSPDAAAPPAGLDAEGSPPEAPEGEEAPE